MAKKSTGKKVAAKKTAKKTTKAKAPTKAKAKTTKAKAATKVKAKTPAKASPKAAPKAKKEAKVSKKAKPAALKKVSKSKTETKKVTTKSAKTTSKAKAAAEKTKKSKVVSAQPTSKAKVEQKAKAAPKGKGKKALQESEVDAGPKIETAKNLERAEPVEVVVQDVKVISAKTGAVVDVRSVLEPLRSLDWFKSDSDECLEKGCDNPITTGNFCRYHYIKSWNDIKKRENILKEGKLHDYIIDLVEKCSPKNLEGLLADLSDDKTFVSILKELNIEAEEEAFDDPDDELADDDTDIAFETKTTKLGFMED